MCTEIFPWETTNVGLTFGELANVQTVGIGLYLALAVIQAVSTTGVAGLSRRLATLKNAVETARIRTEIANIRRLSGEVSGLEIGFYHLNRRLLCLAFFLFIVSVAYFAYCTINQKCDAGAEGLLFIFAFYLCLPVIIFLVTVGSIWRRCRNVAVQVEGAEKRIRQVLLRL